MLNYDYKQSKNDKNRNNVKKLRHTSLNVNSSPINNFLLSLSFNSVTSYIGFIRKYICLKF